MADLNLCCPQRGEAEENWLCSVALPSLRHPKPSKIGLNNRDAEDHFFSFSKVNDDSFIKQMRILRR